MEKKMVWPGLGEASVDKQYGKIKLNNNKKLIDGARVINVYYVMFEPYIFMPMLFIKSSNMHISFVCLLIRSDWLDKWLCSRSNTYTFFSLGAANLFDLDWAMRLTIVLCADTILNAKRFAHFPENVWSSELNDGGLYRMHAIHALEIWILHLIKNKWHQSPVH